MKRLAPLLAAIVAGCATAPGPAPVATPPASAGDPIVPPAMQWLYGSGESGASSLQAYDAFRDYVLERGIRADLSIIKGWKADEDGNLMFRKTARNFNQPAATCGQICVAEVEEIVPVGSLDPDAIHLPSIYVKRMISGAPYDKKIEFRTVREREPA